MHGLCSWVPFQPASTEMQNYISHIQSLLNQPHVKQKKTNIKISQLITEREIAPTILEIK